MAAGFRYNFSVGLSTSPGRACSASGSTQLESWCIVDKRRDQFLSEKRKQMHLAQGVGQTVVEQALVIR